MCTLPVQPASLLQIYPFSFYGFTSLHCKNPTFLYPKLHANVSAKHIHSSHKGIRLFFTLSISFKSSINNK